MQDDKNNAAWFEAEEIKVQGFDTLSLEEKVADLERRMSALEETNCNTQGCCLE